MERLLYLDEGLPLRLAAELQARGHAAQALRRDPGAPIADAELIRSLAGRHGDRVVLVTTDDALPREHGALLRASNLAVALVGAGRGEAYKRETVHRWAHVMASQPAGTVRRYTPRGPRPVRPG